MNIFDNLPSSALVDRVKQLLDPLLSPEEAADRKQAEPPYLTSATPPPPLPPRGSQLVARAKVHLAKRQAQQVYDKFVEQSGPQGEYHSKLYATTELIAVAAILDDPEFTNFRRSMDPQKLAELQESIQLEGLKVPIVVVQSPIQGYYHVRAGFRRITAIKNLTWDSVPAIVLPSDTPESEEYWINIIENTAREKLSTYELAQAAKLMRDRFKVKPSDFAKKAGHSVEYIQDLVLCIDRLPDEVIDRWRDGSRLPLKILVKLSTLTPREAVRNCRLWLGQHRIDASEALKRLERKPEKSGKLWSRKGLEKLQRLHMAIKVSPLPPDTKRICTDIVEYLQGAKQHVPGLVKDRKENEAENHSDSDSDLIRPPRPETELTNQPNQILPRSTL